MFLTAALPLALVGCKKKPAESKYLWDYYTLKATIPAAEAFQPMAASRCSMIKK